MNHAEAYERLVELVGVRAADSSEAELLAHAADCPSCAARLRELEHVERILHSTRGQSIEAPPVPLKRRVLAIPALNTRELPRSRRRAQALVLGAAAAAAAAILAVVLVQPWATTKTTGFQPTRLVTLKAGGPVEAQLALGRPSGSAQPLRLVAEGLPSSPIGSYALWFVGPDGSVMLRSFRPNSEGSCIVNATAPPGRWTSVVITRGSQPPTNHGTIASASL